jgi:hypothetical protein
MAVVLRLIRDTPPISVLDVGGTERFWLAMGIRIGNLDGRVAEIICRARLFSRGRRRLMRRGIGPIIP